MCYEFIYSCESSLQSTMASTVAPDSYCMISIGDIHYLYCNDRKVMSTIKTSLQQQTIRLFSLPADEMISVIDFPGMSGSQQFYGNKILLDRLRIKNGSTAA